MLTGVSNVLFGSLGAGRLWVALAGAARSDCETEGCIGLGIGWQRFVSCGGAHRAVRQSVLSWAVAPEWVWPGLSGLLLAVKHTHVSGIARCMVSSIVLGCPGTETGNARIAAG